MYLHQRNLKWLEFQRSCFGDNGYEFFLTSGRYIGRLRTNLGVFL